ncbi:MAG: hypothetical protein K1X54_02310 [Flavobacteriales bacterium]|nr:hypothetical protein [Flavobacteriales bacterium]
MKHIIFSLAMICSMATFAQSLEAGGYYYDQEHNLYSGEIKTTTEDGLTMVAQVFEGQLHGEAKYFDASGILIETGHHHMGKKDGKWQSFNAQSVCTGEAYYRNGLKDGIWTVWDDHGVKRYHMVYSMGKKVDVWKMWDENSNLVSERRYE